MSCLNPIIIKSPESRWLAKCRKEGRSYEFYVQQANQRRNLQFDPVLLCQSPMDYYYTPNHPELRWIHVPCGKCDLCLKRKVDDIFIRAYYEWLGCIYARRGSVWFITLTYGDDKLPHLDDGTMCFDVTHLQTFLKRLRKVIDYPLKYLLVSEFGGEFGRPHYHGLFYLDNYSNTPNNKYKLLEKIANCWTKIEDRRHEYSSMRGLGLFDVQRVSVDVVDSARLIRYTSKYVGKQYGAVDFDKLKIDSRWKRHTLKSIDFGMCVYDYCPRDAFELGYISVEGFKYNIPSYYMLKLKREYYCEDDAQNIVYRPSDYSLQYMQALSRRQFEEHKNLALLNKDYPVPPSFVYDPISLQKIWDFIDVYRVFREVPNDSEVADFMFEWQDYLTMVQHWNKAHLEAKAVKWRKQQEEYYLKKTHRK